MIIVIHPLAESVAAFYAQMHLTEITNQLIDKEAFL
jgi:hypothetical protein